MEQTAKKERTPMVIGSPENLEDGVDYVWRCLDPILQDLEKSFPSPPVHDRSRITVEPPKDRAHGDLSTNAALVLAKRAQMPPQRLGAMLAQKIGENPMIAQASVAGPGFINISFMPDFFYNHAHKAIKEGARFGYGMPGTLGKIHVEYVSTNPTGPLHIGHARGAVYGDVLANLLSAAGYVVTREYYVNDAGAQIKGLVRSAYRRYCEACNAPIPEAYAVDEYPGEYLNRVGEELFKTYGKTLLNQPEEEWYAPVYSLTLAEMMALIRTDLNQLGIHHDIFFSESSLVEGKENAITDVLRALEDKGLIYHGILPPPQAHESEEMEDDSERSQLLFRSTQFGDDRDRPLCKADGSHTYFAADIAYHRSKWQRGFSTLIDVWGADHSGYVTRMKAAVEAISDKQAHLEVHLCHMVRFLREGQPLKMSKRAGTFVSLHDVLVEVGRDPLRFLLSFRSPDSPLDFDFATAVEHSKANPVFYVQYAHARCASIFRQAEAAVESGTLPSWVLNVEDAQFSLLVDPSEQTLLRECIAYPRLVQNAAKAREPHRIPYFLYEWAATFHGLWNKGKESACLRFVNPSMPELTQARLALVCVVQSVLSSGLKILGVEAPKEMY
jgi:arginyl-tRNA synthetase